MKMLLRILITSLICLIGQIALAQCPSGYTQAQLNWDNLNYYYYTTGAPYANSSTGVSYVSYTMEQTQKFAIGTTDVTFAVSAPGVVKGENGTHTGNLTGYSGNDAQFSPTANGQTITLTFGTEVQNVSFTLYDIDGGSSLTLTAKDASGTAQNITVTKQSTSILTVPGSATTTATITDNGSTLSNSSNQGSATVSVTGPVKTIVLTITTKGSDPNFWFSDITACVPGSFPTNWHKNNYPQPFTGQPSYIINTPDNNNVYMLDPTTGKAWYLFTDPANNYVNSFAYDGINHILYYVTDGSSSNTNQNKTLKKYDFNTDAISVLIPDITSALNIPTFDEGVESAGAAFYNGNLYLGIEGGAYSSGNTRKSIIYRLDLDASGTPTNAVQVFATAAQNSSGSSIHDWGDFMVKDGQIIDFNTARNGTNYSKSSIIHYDMMTGAIANTYNNPGTSSWDGQVGMDWSGNLYSFTNKIRTYNGAGTLSSSTTAKTITVVRGLAWQGGSGDASDPFKPKVDYGDAPASYDPSSGDPAVHEMDSTLLLGTGFDREWTTRGQTALANSDNYDDGVSTVGVFNPTTNNYLISVSVLNNTGNSATLIGWLDYNGNGVFDAAEGVTATVPSSASQQSVDLYWSGISSSLASGSYTYLRLRLTYASNNMTTSNPTGWYNAGEVEDYRVPVSTSVLAVNLRNFDASLLSSKAVQLKWNMESGKDVVSYAIEKSTNQHDWQLVTVMKQKELPDPDAYITQDNHPYSGISYYRLQIMKQDGSIELSDIKKVELSDHVSFRIAPNPARDKAFAYIKADVASPASLEIINAQGGVVYKNNDLFLHAGINNIELPVSSISFSGQYVVHINQNGNVHTQSLIVIK